MNLKIKIKDIAMMTERMKKSKFDAGLSLIGYTPYSSAVVDKRSDDAKMYCLDTTTTCISERIKA